MAKTLRQIQASSLAMDIQEFTSDHSECNDMSVEDFVYYLLDYSQSQIEEEATHEQEYRLRQSD